MPKRVHRKTKRMSKRGGYMGQEYVEGATNAIGQGVTAANEFVGDKVIAPVTGATKEGATDAVSWFGSWFPSSEKSCPPCASASSVPLASSAPPPSPSLGGSRRRRHRKSKNMFTGLMKMVGLNTKKRGKKGGIGGPSQGYQHIVGANFPSAAGPDGNNIYDLAKFNPSKPFYGGMKGGCMHNNLIPLSPAPYPSSDMLGGKTKRHHKKRKYGGKSKRRH